MYQQPVQHHYCPPRPQGLGNQNTEFCPDCGAKIPKDSIFCVECGKKLK